MHDTMIKNKEDEKNNDVDLYTWTRPPSIPEIRVLETYDQVRQVLSDPAFKSDFENRAYDILKSPFTVRDDHI
jgi:hypothetical protein